MGILFSLSTQNISLIPMLLCPRNIFQIPNYSFSGSDVPIDSEVPERGDFVNHKICRLNLLEVLIGVGCLYVHRGEYARIVDA
jgi:hypothetical protein